MASQSCAPRSRLEPVEQIGAQRVRAKRGPMTGSASSAVADVEEAGYGFAYNPRYALSP